MREFFSIQPQALHCRDVYGAGTSSTRPGALTYPESLVLELLAPGRLTETGSESSLLGLGEILECLLLDSGVPGPQPLVLVPRHRQLSTLFGETGSGSLAPAPMRVLLDCQVPHVPGVRTVVEHHMLLLWRRVHAEA
ncbi:hypothetical protein OHV08_17615 [Streptomyces canus]